MSAICEWIAWKFMLCFILKYMNSFNFTNDSIVLREINLFLRSWKFSWVKQTLSREPIHRSFHWKVTFYDSQNCRPWKLYYRDFKKKAVNINSKARERWKQMWSAIKTRVADIPHFVVAAAWFHCLKLTNSLHLLCFLSSYFLLSHLLL